MQVMKNISTKRKRNPIAQNLKVNKPKVYKDKTKYDRKSDNGKDCNTRRGWYST